MIDTSPKEKLGALLLAVLALGWAGLHALELLDRRLEPDVPSHQALVEARLPGVSADELERVLTRPIEREVLRLPSVVDTWAETRDGLVLVVVECAADAVASGEAWSGLEDQLDRLRDDLGEGFVGLSGPVLHRPGAHWAEAVVSVAFTSPDGNDPPVASARALADALAARDVVGHVELVGRPREQIVLTYEDAMLSRAGITPMAFREYLRAQHVLAPGAYLQGDGVIRPLETVSRIRDFESLQTLPVRDPDDGDPVSMSRLLDVRREPVSPTVERVRADGRPAVALAVFRAADAPLDTFADAVRAVVAEHDGRHPVTCELVVFQPDVVDEELSRFGTNLAQGFVLILLLLVGVLGLRAGLSVALVLPFVVLSSFVVMHAAGLGLHVVSLSSFILVLGLLVDNHIVMAERIRRLRELGEDSRAAARRAVGELAGPLTAAAVTTALGFLPVVLTDDPVGHYVGDLFWVVLVALTVSLAFCFGVTPFLQPRADAHRVGASRFERSYDRLLARAFSAPGALALLVLVLMAGGYLLLQSRDQIFFPPSLRPLWLVEIERAPGIELEGTEALVDELQTLLADETRDGGALLGSTSFVGRSAPLVQASIPYREFAPHYAQVLLRLAPDADTDGLHERVTAWMDTRRDDARLRLRPVQLGAPLEWPVQVQVRGPVDGLDALADAVARRLTDAGCVNVNSDWGPPVAKLSIEPDRAALAERDLTVGDVTLGMHSVVHGLPLFDLIEGDVRTPVMLRAAVRRDDPREALADAYVYPRKGDPALLYEVAEVREVKDHPARARRHGVAAVTLRGETPDPDRALAVERDLAGSLGDLRAEHPSHVIEAVGVSASSERANRAMLEQMPWALLAILLVLLAQSRSLVDSLLVLLTVPLSFAGVAFGLTLLGEPFSFMTLIGMTALAGIVVNNAIVLLASIRRAVEQAGAWSRDAVIESAGERVRPILLTTACALASMAVLQVSGSPMWKPLATAVISGLVVATALVLLVLPVLFGVALRWELGGRERS